MWESDKDTLTVLTASICYDLGLEFLYGQLPLRIAYFY